MTQKGRPIPTTVHHAHRAKVGDGKSVRVTATQKVKSGGFYEIGGFFGAAMQSANSGEDVVLNIEQAEYETDQIETTDEFEPGDLIYFKDGEFTTDETDARLVGRVTRGKDSKNVIWFILGPQV